MVGNGEDISATKDQWIRGKRNFCVENDHRYVGRTERVSDYITTSTRSWDVLKVREKFLPEDAKAILMIPIPLHEVHDRVVWADSATGTYTVKEGYRFWYNQNYTTSAITQSKDWIRIWSLLVPHKVKIFIWRFCRNTIPVHWRLSLKGIHLPITCPMCNADVAHVLHIFFDCQSAM